MVCALDTELLGHWWYEGVRWLEAVIEECTRQGVELTRLDDALGEHEPLPVSESPIDDDRSSSWGMGGDLSTWSGPAVADIAFTARAAELKTLAAGHDAGPAAVRELLALQASDWAFMVSRELAVPYARQRYAGHRDALERALEQGPGASTEHLRNLAVHADRRVLLEP